MISRLIETKRRGSWMLLAGLSLTLFGSCAEEQVETVVETAIAVKGTVVAVSDEQLTSGFTGTLEGEQQAILVARLGEAVDQVKVAVGDVVKGDQVLLTLDRHGPSSNYVQARSRFANSKKMYDKMKFLYGEGAVAESEFDAAQTEYEVSGAQFEAVRRSVEIHSPIAGTVTALEVDPGDLVHVGQKLATVATTTRLRLKFGVNQDEIQTLMLGAEVVLSGYTASEPLTGRVVAIASSADTDSRSFQVEALVDNKSGQLKPGMFVHLDYVREELSGVMVVPQHAVLILDDQPTVFAAVGGRAKMKRVVTGLTFDGLIVIETGLAPGDTLIIVGQEYLEDGALLNVTELQELNR